jgi:hypothetical protein
MTRLVNLASESEQVHRVAAAICRGSKVLAMNVNNHRSKYGDNIHTCGHAEVACIHKLFPYAFKGKIKGSCGIMTLKYVEK